MPHPLQHKIIQLRDQPNTKKSGRVGKTQCAHQLINNDLLQKKQESHAAEMLQTGVL